MIAIEHALDIYTDKLNSGEPINLNWFKSRLPADDYIEFTELIPFVKMAKAVMCEQNE